MSAELIGRHKGPARTPPIPRPFITHTMRSHGERAAWHCGDMRLCSGASSNAGCIEAPFLVESFAKVCQCG